MQILTFENHMDFMEKLFFRVCNFYEPNDFDSPSDLNPIIPIRSYRVLLSYVVFG